jgi:seryl-tRNA synthetase
LSDIQVSLDKKTRFIDSTVFRLDQKLNDLDKSIIETNNVREKADKLLERVQALKDKQKALEQNELILFEANYQSAIVNLFNAFNPLDYINSTTRMYKMV